MSILRLHVFNISVYKHGAVATQNINFIPDINYGAIQINTYIIIINVLINIWYVIFVQEDVF